MDGKGEDKVTVEVLTSGLVGCMCVGSPVDRPHTLSTCGKNSTNKHLLRKKTCKDMRGGRLLCNAKNLLAYLFYLSG